MKSRIIEGLSEIADDFDVFFVDIYGVLHNGIIVYKGAQHCLQMIAEAEKSVLLLTNSPKRSSAIITKLENIGIPPSLYQHVVSAGEDTFQHLQERKDPWYARLGDRYYFIGPSHYGLLEGLKSHRVSHIDEADFVIVVGADDWHQKLSDYDAILKDARDQKIPMICANPNRTEVGPRAAALEAGAIAEYFESMGGNVHYHGKPYKSFFQSAMRRYPSTPKERILMIGDSLGVDIAGAANAQLSSAFVTGGLHARELGIMHGHSPSTEDLEQFYQEKQTYPTYTIPGLIW